MKIIALIVSFWLVVAICGLFKLPALWRSIRGRFAFKWTVSSDYQAEFARPTRRRFSRTQKGGCLLVLALLLFSAGWMYFDSWIRAGNGTFTGILAAKVTFGGWCTVDGGVNGYASVSAAYADTANCKNAFVLPGVTTTESSITFTSGFITDCLGFCSLNWGTSGTVTVNQGVAGVVFECDVPFQATDTHACVIKTALTGPGTFMSVGSTSGDTYGFRLINFHVAGQSAGNAANLAYFARLHLYEIRGVSFEGNNGASTAQICAEFDGTGSGAFTGWGTLSAIAGGCNIGFFLNGSGTSGANAGAYELVVTSTAGSSPNGLKTVNSSENYIYLKDCNACTTSINLTSSSVHNHIIFRNETPTTDWQADATSCGNYIEELNGTTSVVDAGKCNFFMDDAFGQFFLGSNGVQGLVSPGSGVLTIGTRTNHPVFFQTNSLNWWEINTSGNFVPINNNNNNLCDPSLECANIFLNGSAGGNASTGAVGEYQSSTIATGSSVSLGTGTTSNITSLSLTAGDWDCTGAVDYTFAGTTSYTALMGGISTTSATLGAQDSGFSFVTPAEVPTASPRDMTWTVPTVRESLGSTTTVFLVTQATFTVSTLKAYGTLRCRRVR